MFELNLITVNSLPLAAALKTRPSSWGKQELTSLSSPPQAFAAQGCSTVSSLDLAVDAGAVRVGSGSSPRTSASPLPAELPHPCLRHSLAQGGMDTVSGQTGSGSLSEKGGSRAAVAPVVVLINVVILRFSCP